MVAGPSLPPWATGAGVRQAALAALSWLARRRDSSGWTVLVGTVIGVASVVLREQLRTPGQVLLGIRTVDRRTGERVALWRTLGRRSNFRGGGSRGAWRRPRCPVRRAEREREDFLAEMHELMQQHPEPSPEREAAREELFARHPSDHLRSDHRCGWSRPTVLFGLLNHRLRRRLAPTVEVLAREG